MIGKDESTEDVSFKISDRRKFNPDGSLREGVEIEPPKPREETTAAAPKSETIIKDAAETTPQSETAEDDLFDESEIPGAEDPASFVNFLSTLATNAIAALGGMPHPATGQRTVDLETGKFWIDILAMLKEKTKGNLHPQESRLLEGLLGDLQMQYVQLVRATEEKLKQQAAKKFSASDILGKK